MRTRQEIADLCRQAETPKELATVIGDALNERDLEIERLHINLYEAVGLYHRMAHGGYPLEPEKCSGICTLLLHHYSPRSKDGIS
jgi:hypothetical protein